MGVTRFSLPSNLSVCQHLSEPWEYSSGSNKPGNPNSILNSCMRSQLDSCKEENKTPGMTCLIPVTLKIKMLRKVILYNHAMKNEIARFLFAARSGEI